VRSDAYELTDAGEMKPAYEGVGPVVSLDKDYYRLLPDFDKRFPSGPPSLRRCRRLRVEGDVTFGAGVVVDGDVSLTGPRHIKDGEVLGG
jgi:UTP--glucose-1-phosphate uridylyltransferase